MRQFDMPPQTRLKIIKVTPRKEPHGKELVQAVSLRMEWWPKENIAVNQLHEGLQDLLWWVPPELAAQAQIEGVPAVKKNRRVPTLHMPLKVEVGFSGYDCVIERGIDETTELELYACNLDKFEVDAKEGGSVAIRWSLATNKQVTPQLVGLLCGLESTEVVMTLTPPSIAEGEVIDGTKGHPGAAAAGDDVDAGDLFADAARKEIDAIAAEEAGADRHAGDFGQADDDAAGPGAGSSDDAGTLDDGDTGQVKGAADSASNDAAAELEAGMAQAMAAAGMQPKAARRGRRIGGTE